MAQIRNAHPAGATGNVTSPAVTLDGDPDVIALNFVIEAIGSTPTVTFVWQGSIDGTTWFPLLYVTDSADTAATTAITKTAVGATPIWPSNNQRRYRFYRCVTSANTNVTYHSDLIEYD